MKNLKIAFVSMALLASGLAANAQKYGKTPEDSVRCITNISLYTEFYKQKNYADAYTPWRETLKTCPASSKNLYIRGVTIMKYMINNAKAQAERDTLIAELMQMYDLRIANFGEAGENTAKKAMDLEAFTRDAGVKDYYPIYAEAVRLGGERLDAAYVTKYFEATVKYVKAGYAEPSLVVDNYDLASDLLDKQYRANREDSAKAATIARYISSVEAAFSPYASCEQLVSIYTKKFEASPNDVALLTKITTIMRKKKCMSEELFFKATQNLHALQPSPSTALLMGQMCVNNQQYSKAVEYLNEAAKGLTEPDDLYSTYLAIGMANSAQRSYGAARAAYNKAAELDPTKGDPLFRIAQLYGQSAGMVDDGMSGRSVYWVAVDQARRALAVDNSEEFAATVNKFISTCSQHFPKQADAFMLNLLDGNSYTVGGWIGVSTTVRTRK